jgi:hypothetical protein
MYQGSCYDQWSLAEGRFVADRAGGIAPQMG